MAVVFDLHITLTDFRAERRRPEFAAALAESLGVDQGAFSTLMRSTYDERATGAMGDIRATLAALARRLGADPDDKTLDGAVALRREQELVITQPRDGVLDVLSCLRSLGYRVGMISDCTPELPELWSLLPYEEAVDAAVFSCEFGRRKPAAVLYHEVARRLDVTPPRCLYVGDGSSGELTGAKEAGMIALMVSTPLANEFRYDAEPDWQGPTIDDLTHLVPLLSHLGEG